MVKVFLLFVVFIIAGSTGSNCSAEQPDSFKTILYINFCDNFKHDVVSLKLNKKLVFKDELLDSNTSGFANAQIFLVRKNAHMMTVQYLNEKTHLSYSNYIKLVVTLNGVESKFVIFLNKGKYIELSKKDKGHFYFSQTKTPTIWD